MGMNSVTSTSPSRRGPPGDQGEGVGGVRTRRGGRGIRRPEAPTAVLGVAEKRAEHGCRVESRHAEPVDRAVVADQRGRAAVPDDGVLLDRLRHGQGRPSPRTCHPGCTPRREVEHVAPVDDATLGDEPSGLDGIERAILAPLRHEHHELGAAQRLLRRGGVVELRMPPPRVLDALRIGGDHLRAEALEVHRHVERRRVAHVVGVGLERHAQHGDPLAVDRTAERRDGEVDDALALAHVDRVHLAEERERVAAPELLGARGERADVLRQAAAAEADAGVQEAAADAGVVSDGVGEGRDVGTGRVGDLRHRVDEADLRGEERVRRRLHELGGGVVGDDAGGSRLDGRAIDAIEHGCRVLVCDPVHQPVGLQRVLHREPLAQELGVPGETRVRCDVDEPSSESCGRAHRHGALADDERAVGEVREQRLERRVDVAEVGGAGARRLRRADGEEVHLGTRGIRDVGAEPQATGGRGGGEDLGQSGLEERRMPRCERGDLALVDIDAHDLVAEFGHRRGVHGTEVAAADHRDAHAHPSFGHCGPFCRTGTEAADAAPAPVRLSPPRLGIWRPPSARAAGPRSSSCSTQRSWRSPSSFRDPSIADSPRGSAEWSPTCSNTSHRGGSITSSSNSLRMRCCSCRSGSSWSIALGRRLTWLAVLAGLGVSALVEFGSSRAAGEPMASLDLLLNAVGAVIGCGDRLRGARRIAT